MKHSNNLIKIESSHQEPSLSVKDNDLLKNHITTSDFSPQLSVSSSKEEIPKSIKNCKKLKHGEALLFCKK